jgi:methyl-accepting chemotaxis protein
MNKLLFRVATPIILAGIFSISIFIALNYESLQLSFFIVMILLIVYIFFFGFAIGQNFSAPVKKLIDRATDLNQGDLTTRVYLETKDEFGELAKIFNEIAQKLEQSQGETKTAESAVDIKVRAKTQALEETINALDQKVRNRTIELERLINDSGRLQQQAKIKEDETVQLKKELDSFKSRVGKYKSSKT